MRRDALTRYTPSYRAHLSPMCGCVGAAAAELNAHLGACVYVMPPQQGPSSCPNDWLLLRCTHTHTNTRAQHFVSTLFRMCVRCVWHVSILRVCAALACKGCVWASVLNGFTLFYMFYFQPDMAGTGKWVKVCAAYARKYDDIFGKFNAIFEGGRRRVICSICLPC